MELKKCTNKQLIKELQRRGYRTDLLFGREDVIEKMKTIDGMENTKLSKKELDKIVYAVDVDEYGYNLSDDIHDAITGEYDSDDDDEDDD